MPIRMAGSPGGLPFVASWVIEAGHLMVCLEHSKRPCFVQDNRFYLALSDAGRIALWWGCVESDPRGSLSVVKDGPQGRR